MIDASPTRMDTVYTILTQSVAIADSLELDSLVLVMDQAIYSKAQQIRGQNDSFKERLYTKPATGASRNLTATGPVL